VGNDKHFNAGQADRRSSPEGTAERAERQDRAPGDITLSRPFGGCYELDFRIVEFMGENANF
jgi:hypothetical protein